MDFSAKIGNSNGFSAQNQVISKKKSSPKLRRIFRLKSETQTVLPAESRQLLSQLRHPNPFGVGELFSFFEQKSAAKALKTCDFAYFSGQWGGSSPPVPPGYATELETSRPRTSKCVLEAKDLLGSSTSGAQICQNFLREKSSKKFPI